MNPLDFIDISVSDVTWCFAAYLFGRYREAYLVAIKSQRALKP